MKKLPLLYLLALIVLVNTLSSCQKAKDGDAVATDSLKIGLIAYYPFNNSGVDVSGNNNDGYVNSINSASDRHGKDNAAYYFDGATSFIQVKDNQALRLSNTDFSINVWVKLDTYNYSFGSEILAKRGAGNNNGYSYGVHGIALTGGVIAGQTTFQVSGGNDPFAAGVKTLNTGTWYMLTTIFNVKKQTLSFYINGVLDNVTTNMAIPPNTTSADLFIGKDNPQTSSPGYYFKGYLDDLSIYGRALSITDIQKLYISTY